MKILQWGKTPQCAGEPVPAGVRRIGYNSGLTRKTLTQAGTKNGQLLDEHRILSQTRWTRS